MAGLPRFWTAMHAREPCGGGAGVCPVEPPHPGLRWVGLLVCRWLPLLSAAASLSLRPLSNPSSVDPIQRRDRPGSRGQEPQRNPAPRASSSAFRSLALMVSVWWGGLRGWRRPSQAKSSQANVRSGESMLVQILLACSCTDPVHIVQTNRPIAQPRTVVLGKTRASFGHAVDCSS